MKVSLKPLLAAGTLGLVLLGSSAAYAHHSASMFDSAKEVSIEGTVKQFQYINPHAWLLVETKGPSGAMMIYNFELAAPTALARMGIVKSSFTPGEKIVARGHPMRDGKPAAEFTYAVNSQGKTVGRPMASIFGGPPAGGPPASVAPPQKP